MLDYYALLTTAGEQQLAASVLGDPLGLVSAGAAGVMEIGTGDNFAEYDPTKAQTTLKGKVAQVPLNRVAMSDSSATQFFIDAIIPPELGGWTIREFGIRNAAGELLIVGKYPPSFKPLPTDSAAKALTIRAVLDLSSAALIMGAEWHLPDYQNISSILNIHNAIGKISLAGMQDRSDIDTLKGA